MWSRVVHDPKTLSALVTVSTAFSCVSAAPVLAPGCCLMCSLPLRPSQGLSATRYIPLPLLLETNVHMSRLLTVTCAYRMQPAECGGAEKSTVNKTALSKQLDRPSSTGPRAEQLSSHTPPNSQLFAKMVERASSAPHKHRKIWHLYAAEMQRVSAFRGVAPRPC